MISLPTAGNESMRAGRCASLTVVNTSDPQSWDDHTFSPVSAFFRVSEMSLKPFRISFAFGSDEISMYFVRSCDIPSDCEKPLGKSKRTYLKN